VLKANLITQIMLGSRKSKFTSDVKRIVVKTEKANNGGSFSGLDRFNTNQVNTTQKMVFSPRSYYQPIVLPGDELSLSKTKESVRNLQVQKGEEASQEMAEDIGALLYGDGTGNSNKDFLGLIAGADDGTNVATYGGLSRATYTTIKGTVDSTTTTITFDALDTMLRSTNSGNQKVDLMLTTEAIYDYVAALFTAVNNERNAANSSNSLIKTAISGIAGEAGFTSLFYKGVPIIADESCPDNHLFCLNTSTWEFATVDGLVGTTPIMIKSAEIEGQYDSNVEKSYGFHITPMKWVADQYGFVSQILLMGNLICKNPRRNGYFSAITS
jgi:hypothetical protein